MVTFPCLKILSANFQPNPCSHLRGYHTHTHINIYTYKYHKLYYFNKIANSMLLQLIGSTYYFMESIYKDYSLLHNEKEEKPPKIYTEKSTMAKINFSLLE